MSSPTPAPDRRGSVLVVVLAMLALLTVVVVAFLESASRERTAVTVSDGLAAARTLADNTVSYAIAQIRHATVDVPDGATWVSQPGAIRHYSGYSTGAWQPTGLPDGTWFPEYTSGPQDRVFRLYSSGTMELNESAFVAELEQEAKVIEQWPHHPDAADYVDLNEPLRTSSIGIAASKEPRLEFPIVDPRAMTLPNGGVHGFSCLQSPADESPSLPMPARWLYFLADGRLDTGENATVKNPIVGRTAFWVDDESSKLNVNTASEGTFWDTPSVSSLQESGQVDGAGALTTQGSQRSLALSASQPVRGEYQRYPGHPATTCLSPVFGWIGNLRADTPAYPRALDGTSLSYADFKDLVHEMSPFIGAFRSGQPASFTSRGGTYNAHPHLSPTQEPLLHVATRHHYATVDEYFLKPKRESPQRLFEQIPDLEKPALFSRHQFFLSAQSRSPEVTMLGGPRVGIWPVADDAIHRTAYDERFQFTSTVGGRFYGLRRKDAKSAITDFQINRSMFDYLREMTSRRVPGYGKSFLEKWGQEERDQVLVSIMDYMRTVNLVDKSSASQNSEFIGYTPPYGSGPSGNEMVGERSRDWSGQVTPLRTEFGHGMGRFPMISEAAIVFERDNTHIRAILLLEMATPMPGYPVLRETYYTRVRELAAAPNEIRFGSATAPWQPLNFPREFVWNICNVPSHAVHAGLGFLPTLGVSAQLHWHAEHRAPSSPERYPSVASDPAWNPTSIIRGKTLERGPAGYVRQISAAPASVQYYPFVSDRIPMPFRTFNMQWKGGTFEVEIYSGEAPDDPRSQLVQRVTLRFPNEVVLLPTPSPRRFLQVFLDGSRDDKGNLFERSDFVVRSIEFTGGASLPLASKGDLRLGMKRKEISVDSFEPRAGYFSYDQFVHGFALGNGAPMIGTYNAAPNGSLAAGGTIRTNKPPILPANVDGVKRLDGGPGDWDRGLSKHIDGAFGNKVDEGISFFDYTKEPDARLPYFRELTFDNTGTTFFSPNRQIASPVMFGSLPTGSVRRRPWQTLLFRPDREATRPQHPGTESPPDHLLLDLFHMPVIEPWAISEPLSTAGKVNLNHIIAPYGYARTADDQPYLLRETALRGVLKAVKVMAVPNTTADGGHAEKPTTVLAPFRFDIHGDKTMAGINARLLHQKGLFRSASEICEMDLHPADETGKPVEIANWNDFWREHALTGDNMRERPYAHIHPRITTQSNVFTVHFRTQSIKKGRNSRAEKFDPTLDRVTGEFRGSAVIERYIDPNDPALAHFDPLTDRLDRYYRFRIISQRQLR